MALCVRVSSRLKPLKSVQDILNLRDQLGFTVSHSWPDHDLEYDAVARGKYCE